MEEAGVPGYEVNEWNPMLAPAGIKPATKAALQDALRVALADPEVLGRIRSLSGDVFADNADAKLTAFLQGQRSQWARIVRERKISIE